MQLRCPVMNPRISSPFGYRVHPITGQRGKLHKGIDYANTGYIYAAAHGKVRKVGYNPNKRSGYGHYIYIDHGGGLQTLYAHMLRPSPFKVGDRVKAGVEVGLIGNSGASTGRHLHFETILNWRRVDPAHYLNRARLVVKVTGRYDRQTKIGWQKFLSRTGHYTGLIDGIVGPMTITAIQRSLQDMATNRRPFVNGRLDRFTKLALQQRLAALPYDGIWGRITMTKLQNALNAGSYSGPR